MVEIEMELPANKPGNSGLIFPPMTDLELKALVYVIQKLIRAWELKGRDRNER